MSTPSCTVGVTGKFSASLTTGYSSRPGGYRAGLGYVPTHAKIVCASRLAKVVKRALN